MHELSQIDVITLAQVEQGEESLSDNTREVGISEDGDLVDTL
jgi:hypothetical protein